MRPDNPSQEVQHFIGDRRAVLLTGGQSGAVVYRYERSGTPAMVLKVTPRLSEEAGNEGGRLEWLRTQGISCPAVIQQTYAAGHEWLLMTALAGSHLGAGAPISVAEIVDLAADALKSLHDLEPSACPYDASIVRCLADAEVRVRDGLIDEDDFDEARKGQSAREVLDWLKARHPGKEDRVVTHGDASFENLMASAGRFSGFIDCGALGVSDRYRDLALICRSIDAAFGKAGVARFFARYGRPMNAEKLHYYAVLDEMF